MKKKGVKEYWSMTEGVFNCLIDKERSLAFQKTIKNTVRKGDIVVDMGSGSGILAMFAARAGARKVYAIEYDEKNILFLKETFKKNNLGDIIAVIKGDITKIILPEKVDVIIGEMIATALIEELQLQAMNNVLKYVNKGYRVLLSKYLCGADLVYNNNKYYNLVFDTIRYEYSDVVDTKSKKYTETQYYKEVTFSKVNKNNLVNSVLEFKINKNGAINGLRLTGKTIFFDNSEFGDSFAYSYPIILPMQDTLVKKGDKFKVNINYKLCEGFKNFNYSICKI